MAIPAPAHDRPAFAARWLTYFDERFPLPQYGVALAAFTWAAQAYGGALHGERGWPSALPFLGALAVALLVFLQLRILDEFKDREDDAKYRPYRPVPRGLVTLAELKRLWIAAAAIEVAIAVALGPRAVLLLALVLAYSGLMGVEFFVRAWLRSHAAAYLGSHMLIVPMIAAFLVEASGHSHRFGGIAPFLAFSYLTLCVFELGRKTWAPGEERAGVETYSALWGPRRAVLAWMGTLVAAALAGAVAAAQVDIVLVYALAAASLAAAAAVTAARFLLHPERARGKSLLAMSGAWLIGICVAFGAAIALLPWTGR